MLVKVFVLKHIFQEYGVFIATRMKIVFYRDLHSVVGI